LFIADKADIAVTCTVGDGTMIWDHAQVREGARIGEGCTIGRAAHIGEGTTVGDRCKIQDHALIYGPARLEDGVFVGPGALLTNDPFPRAVTPDGVRKTTGDWKPAAVLVERGASIGAGAVCVAPVVIGSWAMVAAGAVVTRNVPDHALVAGVPARRIGWVGRAGIPLVQDAEGWVCPATGERYRENDDKLEAVA
jgi:acetyltransferase-like isoleucine patch superfamily enzyme